MWHPGRARTNRTATKDDVGGARHLLEGRASHPYVRGEPVASWIPIKGVAHSGIPELKDLVGIGRYAERGSWIFTLGLLAEEILAAAPDNPSLLHLQRRSLIPLELEVMAGPAGGTISPEHLIAMVREAIQTETHRDR
jgi:hypothetical protein